MGKMYHFDVGFGDASLIRTGRTFLIDCHNIDDHAGQLPSSKKLRGVFITHQHRDHFSGLEYLRRNGYSIEHLVYSPYDRRRGDSSVTLEEWNEFNDHRDYFARKGTKLHSSYRQSSFEKAWWKTNDLTFWILGPLKATATSPTREIHDACLVVKMDMGNRHCLFTGDASDSDLQDVAGIKNNCNDILHASHHGSLAGADLDFIKSANATYTVISTEEGVHENVPHPTALRRYRENTSRKVYRTDKDGTQVWTF